MSDIEHAKALPRAGWLALLGRPAFRFGPRPGRSFLICLAGLAFLLAGLPAGWAQFAPPKVYRIDIKHLGPPATSDELVRSNLRIKVGKPQTDRYVAVRIASDDAGLQG